MSQVSVTIDGRKYRLACNEGEEPRLESLAGLTKLVNLELDSVNVTDASVAHLASLRSLRELDLYHTLITEKGLQDLKTALPNCQIHYDRDSTKRERRSS